MAASVDARDQVTAPSKGVRSWTVIPPPKIARGVINTGLSNARKTAPIAMTAMTARLSLIS